MEAGDAGIITPLALFDEMAEALEVRGAARLDLLLKLPDWQRDAIYLEAHAIVRERRAGGQDP
jgi:hypothetical protein